jgi:hypothetical protein
MITVISVIFCNAPAVLDNHRSYAQRKGYRHIAIDASDSFSDLHAQWLYKYETLLDHFCRASACEGEIALLLNERSVIVEDADIERVMQGRKWLIVETPNYIRHVGCQFWRNTEVVRAGLRQIIRQCSFGKPLPGDEKTLFENISKVPTDHIADGCRVIMPASSYFPPEWLVSPTFLVTIGEPDILRAAGASGDRVSGRFVEAIAHAIAQVKSGRSPAAMSENLPENHQSPFSVINPGRPIALVTLYTPNIAPIGRFSEVNFERYCELHGYTLYVYRDIPEHARDGSSGNWLKPLLLLNHLAQHEWLFWFDADILFHNMKLELASLTHGKNVVAARDVSQSLINSGVMGFRNTEENLAGIREVANRIAALEDKSNVFANFGDQPFFCDVLQERGLLREEDILSPFTINTNWPFHRRDSLCTHYAGMSTYNKLILMQFDASNQSHD